MFVTAIAALLVACSPVLGATEALELFVAPDGDDSNPGTMPEPLATLTAARDAVRAVKNDQGLPDGGVTVCLRAGSYRLTESFTLTNVDSGMDDAPVTYRAHGDEAVTLLGGICLDPGLFLPLTDAAIRRRIIDESARDRVLHIDLRALGIDSLDPVQPRGMMHPVRPAPIELFVDGQPMTLARWPNVGEVRTGKVIDAGSRPRHNEKPDRPARFQYRDDRHALWTDADDAWLVGYWQFDWADESIPIESIDADNHTITLATPHHYGVAEGKPYYVENLLEEIDEAGEYYVDRSTGMLYFFPPSPLDGTRIIISLLTEPVIVMDDVSHVTLSDLTIEAARGDAVRVRGGAGNTIVHCVLRNLGNRAVVVEGGTEHRVMACNIHQTGEGGIVLAGGDRPSLTPARHAALDNHIHDFSRRCRTYRPAVHISGVGQRVAHNHMHDAPHSAIIFSGNDHLIEYNDIHDVLRKTGDGGAVYTGRDWSMCGTVIQYNFFHDLHGVELWENAVYIDDQSGGVTIRGNIFADCHWGMLLGGGRDIVVENNIFTDCKLAVHFDARGLGWASGALGLLKERLEAMPYMDEPWASRYPRLVSLLDDDPMTPKGNILRRNILHRSGSIHDELAGSVVKYSVIENNLETNDAAGAGAWELPGFERIPLELIGPRDAAHPR
ncbi:MAG: right-handed parallel beta-helix repeat-containing protein [Phycisphaerales bacterium]|nr:right-handed parallel beta-helix repeat-containing protein [Phycisphaerales bacterium]